MAGMPKRRAKREAKPLPGTLTEEQSGALLADILAPHDSNYAEIASRHGVTTATVTAFLKALRTTHLGLYEASREVTAAELLPMMTSRQKQLLQHMTVEKMAEAGIRDLGVTFGILSEKVALARGEPTQILGTDDRKKLLDAMPFIIQEAERRGLVVEGEFVDVDEDGDPGGGTRTIVPKGEDIVRTKDYAPVRKKTTSRARPG